MKNIKAFALLLVATVLGLGAALYANIWIGQRTQLAANKVVVSAVDIPAGSRLEPEMLTTVDWPSTSLPAGATTDAALLKGRVVKLDMVRGEAVIDGKLAPVGTMGGLSAVITEGKRAMTVRVNDVVGVAGFALPGNYVDILVHAQRDGDARGETKPISKTVLEHVLVLAVAQEAGRDDTKPKVVNAVTLELSLADSEKLDLARSIGTLSLALRNQADQETVSTAGITKNELFGEPRVYKAVVPVHVAKERPVRVAPRNCVEVIEMPDGSSRLSCFN
ncbi:Flp pilus assembly protein CpaB [Massilia phosphatilytica]|nr:Flp pilus assembly protein CpaB [Massilia phosphatilytica]